jgi:hypothetical protein
MYSKDEFKILAGELPPDFGSKTQEFWAYVEEKLSVFKGRINRVYRDGTCRKGKHSLSKLKSIDPDNFSIIDELINDGASFEFAENSLLIEESESWLKILKSTNSNAVTLEMCQQAMDERNKDMANRIHQTLEKDEIGVLFIEPSRRIKFEDDIEVIAVYRFNPFDYLSSWQTKQRLRTKVE